MSTQPPAPAPRSPRTLDEASALLLILLLKRGQLVTRLRVHTAAQRLHHLAQQVLRHLEAAAFNLALRFSHLTDA